MEDQSPADDLTMSLVEQALHCPEGEREGYLRDACGSDEQLFAAAWKYVQWEKRMQGFLLDPLSTRQNKTYFEPGKVIINRFRIVREVAQGGMGIVWEAIDQKLERHVALKGAKAGHGKQLPPEVRNAREISHPNVCKIFEIHTASTPDGEIDFVSMEFLDGETLADRIQRERPTEKEARAIALQLCHGLAEAHRNHLVHGDLKTRNVILTKDCDGSLRAVITDFGLARRVDTTGGLVGGTRGYMAPELLRGGTLSVASDIYALGILFRELHSGHPSADAEPVSNRLSSATRRMVHQPRAMHGKWERIIARCAAPDPKRRFQSVVEVGQALGPHHLLRKLAAAGTAVCLAVGSGVITYQHTTAPVENVRLALLPVPSDHQDASLSESLLHGAITQLAQLLSTAHTRYRFISWDKVIRNRVYTNDEAHVLLNASHTLRVTIEHRPGGLISVKASLKDLSSESEGKWSEQYKAEEIKYAPAAITALVTETLHLPAPIAGQSIKAAARADFSAGLNALKHDNTINVAIDNFRRAANADPDSAIAFANLAEAAWYKFTATNDKIWLKLAEDSLRQAQLRNPDLPEVHSLVGLLKIRAGDYDDAINEHLRAIELEPRNGDAYCRLARAYESQGRRADEVISAYRKAIQINPNLYRTYRYFGDFFMNQGSYPEAIVQITKALSLEAREPMLHYHLGEIYVETGRFVEAEKEMRTSLALGERSFILHGLGVLLIYEGRNQDAISAILRSLQRGPEKSLYWMNLGTAYRRAGLASKAASAYRHGLQLAKTELIRNHNDALAKSYLAYLCARLKNPDWAESEIGQALKIAPTKAEVIFVAADVYETLGRRDETIALLATAPRLVLADLSRWPDLAGLQKDPRFLHLLTPEK